MTSHPKFITGCVEATFPSMKGVSAIMVQAGASKEYFSDAVAFHDQVHGQLRTRGTAANKYGNGESPDTTLGLQDIRHLLKPFFCPCTVDVGHLGLTVGDDGSIRKLSDAAPTADSSIAFDDDGNDDEPHLGDVTDKGGHLVGRIKAIKRIGGFLLSVGGGLDRSWNGSSFPGTRF